MIGFTGQSYTTLKIFTKPTPKGYKGQVLAQKGYVLAWLQHAKQKGLISFSKVPKLLGSNKTAAVVPFLLEMLPKVPGFCYVVQLDNLFTSTKLLRYLQDLNFGAVSTYCTNSGICKDFVNKKNQDKKVDNIPQGIIY